MSSHYWNHRSGNITAYLLGQLQAIQARLVRFTLTWTLLNELTLAIKSPKDHIWLAP